MGPPPGTGLGTAGVLPGMGRFGSFIEETAEHHWRVTAYHDTHVCVNHYYYNRRADSIMANDRTHEHRHRTVTSHVASTQAIGEVTTQLMKYLHHEQHWNNYCQVYTHYCTASGPTIADNRSPSGDGADTGTTLAPQNSPATPATQWDTDSESHRWHHNRTNSYFHFHHGASGHSTHTCKITSHIDGPHKHNVITNRYHFYLEDDQAALGDEQHDPHSGTTGQAGRKVGTPGDQGSLDGDDVHATGHAGRAPGDRAGGEDSVGEDGALVPSGPDGGMGFVQGTTQGQTEDQ